MRLRLGPHVGDDEIIPLGGPILRLLARLSKDLTWTNGLSRAGPCTIHEKQPGSRDESEEIIFSRPIIGRGKAVAPHSFWKKVRPFTNYFPRDTDYQRADRVTTAQAAASPP